MTQRIVATTASPHRERMEIRDAREQDAPAACLVLRRSIIELCVTDHRHDPEILRQWLDNKTLENVASWIRQPRRSVLVAVQGCNVLGVGSVSDDGEITLNYVSPEARFQGVSRAMMAALEARAKARGNTRCRLSSTETARMFYLANGYAIDGPAVVKFGVGGYPMSKSLAR